MRASKWRNLFSRRADRKVWSARVSVRSFRKKPIFELLEDRRMLAVGSFLRQDGQAVATSHASGEVNWGEWEAADVDGSDNTMIANATSAVVVDAPPADVEAVGQATAMIPTPIGGSIAVAQLSSTAQSENLLDTDDPAEAGGWGGGIGSARANYRYDADPTYSQNMVFHGHLFVGGNGGAVYGGDASVGYLFYASASIGDYGMALHLNMASNTWELTGNIPGATFPQTHPNSGNIHLDFSIPIVDGATFEFETSAVSDGSTGVYGEGFALVNVATMAGAWGYVDGEGVPEVLGDFNRDGAVDVQDLKLWQQGSLLADTRDAFGNYDGVIDMDDYDVWLANTTDDLIVSTDVDELDTDYSFGDLSFREALALAGDGDALSFHPSLYSASASEIVLAYDGADSGSVPDQLVIDDDVEIVGPGDDHLTIDGNDVTRVLLVDWGVTATVSGMTITGGYADYGGGISAVGTTTLDSVRVTDNHATVDGGGVYAYGDVTIKSSRIDDNSAVQNGGGLFVNSTGATTVTDTTIDNNEALCGAGIYGFLSSYAYALIIRNSTIADNTAIGTWSFGGGMLLRAATSGGAALIANSTISGNAASYNGGIRLQDGVVANLVNDTIAYNMGDGGSGLEAVSGTNVWLANTIVSENVGASNYNINGTFDALSRYNLIGVGNNSNISNGTLGNIVLTSGTAGLATLADNGGPTRTNALLSSSQAIDAGLDQLAAAFDMFYDQRGEGFDRILDGGIDGDIDIGAFEFS